MRLGRATEADESAFFKNVEAERLFNAEFDILKERSVFRRSKSLQALFCPLQGPSGEVCGVLRVFRNHEKKEFTLQERETIDHFAGRLGNFFE